MSISIQHKATFLGKHNRVKTAALLTLAEHPGGLTCRGLSLLSGCSYQSLATLCSLWCKWHYLKRRLKDDVYFYRLAERGQWFLDVRLPPIVRHQVEADIASARAKIPNYLLKAT